ncbi:hypothetical protein CGZ80_21210 [Rhodopirellula sp. MGV]|nr:hypothetical protein CGZ80_21210 [Rhodopirellula sp. MGV]PNY36000.1 hypothetical protein C2E31_15260 [Rhodopirellula baltica]
MSTALLSTSTIQDNPTPDAPTASSKLVTLRNADRVNLSSAANCGLSSWGRRELFVACEGTESSSIDSLQTRSPCLGERSRSATDY